MTKKTKLLKGLMNWPPSRGPMPAWMRKRPTVKVPTLTVKIVRPPPLTPKQIASRRRRSAKMAEALYAAMKRKPKGRSRSRKGWHKLADLRKEQDAQQNLDLRCNVHVATLAELTADQASHVVAAWDTGRRGGKGWPRTPHGGWALFPTRPLTVRLNYPLSVEAFVKVRPCWSRGARTGRKFERLDEGLLLWQVARFYRDVIYKQWKKYGVWGHALHDLYFESITIRGNRCEIGMGS